MEGKEWFGKQPGKTQEEGTIKEKDIRCQNLAKAPLGQHKEKLA